MNMYSPFLLASVMVIGLSFTKADNGNFPGFQQQKAHAIEPLNGQYNAAPPYDARRPGSDAINFGNGHNKNNVVNIRQNQDGTSFQGVSFPNSGNANPEYTRQNFPNNGGLGVARHIGNGYANRNTVTIEDGDRTRVITQTGDGGRDNPGLSFRSRNAAGDTDHFDIGYGTSNANRVIITNNRQRPQQGQGSQQSPEAKSVNALHEIALQLQQITIKLTEIMRNLKV